MVPETIAGDTWYKCARCGYETTEQWAEPTAEEILAMYNYARVLAFGLAAVVVVLGLAFGYWLIMVVK